MGVERMHPPKYWRDRAEEFRAKADHCEYPEMRFALLPRTMTTSRGAPSKSALSKTNASYSVSSAIDELRPSQLAASRPSFGNRDLTT